MNSDDEMLNTDNFKYNGDYYKYNFLAQLFINEASIQSEEEVQYIDNYEKQDAKNFYEDDEDKEYQPTVANSNNPNDSSNQTLDLKENNYNNQNKNKGVYKIKKINEKTNISYENQSNLNQNLVNNNERKDNMRLRIKNNFRHFYFDYLNELIKNEYKYQKFLFRKPEYEISGENKKENKEFFQKKLFEIIEEKDISPKYKTKNPEQNKKNLKRLNLNDNSKVSNFLNMTMEFIYNNYFLKKEENYNEVNFFDDFIEELKNTKDEKYIEKIKKIAKEDFISYYKKSNKKSEFLSKKRLKFVCTKK